MRNIGIEVGDALEISEQTEISLGTANASLIYLCKPCSALPIHPMRWNDRYGKTYGRSSAACRNDRKAPSRRLGALTTNVREQS